MITQRDRLSDLHHIAQARLLRSVVMNTSSLFLGLRPQISP
jgi:hypothetical protein